MDTPYITFINDESENGDTMLTWYYGIGYKYYSESEDGLYDATLAEKKSSKNPAKKDGEQQLIYLKKLPISKLKI